MAAADPTRLVYAKTHFHPGLRAGSIGEVPVKLADMAIANGHATEVDSVEGRQAVSGSAVNAFDPPAESSSEVTPEQPRGNASRDAWVAYAEGKGAAADELADLIRDEIAEKFGA